MNGTEDRKLQIHEKMRKDYTLEPLTKEKKTQIKQSNTFEAEVCRGTLLSSGSE